MSSSTLDRMDAINVLHPKNIVGLAFPHFGVLDMVVVTPKSTPSECTLSRLLFCDKTFLSAEHRKTAVLARAQSTLETSAIFTTAK